MFDFAAVGLPVALVGLAFISFVGWRLLPRQETAGAQNEDRFHINRYVSQATLPANSDLVGQTVREIENLCGNEVTVMAIIRGRRRMLVPAGNTGFEADDILLLEGDTVALQPLFDATGLVHVGAELVDPNELETGQVRMVEVVVMPGSAIEGSSMRGLKMHEYFGMNLLAMSREGGAPVIRLGSVRFKVGDVLLLQGHCETFRDEPSVARLSTVARARFQAPHSTPGVAIGDNLCGCCTRLGARHLADSDRICNGSGCLVAVERDVARQSL